MAGKSSKTKKNTKKSTKSTKSNKKAIVKAKDVKSAVLKATSNGKKSNTITTKKKKSTENKSVDVNKENTKKVMPKSTSSKKSSKKVSGSKSKKLKVVSKTSTKVKKEPKLVENKQINIVPVDLEQKNVPSDTSVIENISKDEVIDLENVTQKEEIKVNNEEISLKADEIKNVNDKVDLKTDDIVPEEVKIVDEKKLKKRELLGKKKIYWDCVIFDAILLLVFAFLIIALFRIEVLKGKTILFIGCLIGFLILIAVSYNKHLSGKLFTIILCTAMGFTIYRLQYTYDFIHNLNTSDYEYRTYYVVALDTSINRSIYNINGKRVGMLKDNNTNIRRVLNTKLDNVTYVYYEDADKLFDAFYKQDVRAVIVGDNYYKFLLNNESTSNKKAKSLYEFKANAHK